MNIMSYISDNENHDQAIYLSGRLDNKLYHTVCVPHNGGHEPFILFEDGSSIKIELEKKRHSFTHKGQRYCFLNGPKLSYAPELINYPSNKAFTLVAKQLLPNKHDLYKSLIDILNEFYDFYCTEECRIVAAHIIHSYLICSLGTTFYLLLEGGANTGKSSLQKIISKLEYHGCFIAQATIPVLARKLHCMQASIQIDEFDKVFNHRDDKSSALAFFNSGFYSGGTYEITNTNARSLRDQIQVIQTFSAKTFSANKLYLNPTLSSRCVTIHTVRGKRRTKRLERLSPEDKQRILEIRDNIFAYCLMNGKSILMHIDDIQNELGEGQIWGRDSDILSIILGIERQFDQDDQLKEFLLEKRELDEDDSKENDRTYVIYQFLLHKCSTVGTQVDHITFTNSDLVDYINETLSLDGVEITKDYAFSGKPSPFAATPSSVGKLLKLNKIITRKNERRRITTGDYKGRWEYLLSRKKILDLLKRCPYTDIQKDVTNLEDYIQLGQTAPKDVPLPF